MLHLSADYLHVLSQIFYIPSEIWCRRNIHINEDDDGNKVNLNSSSCICLLRTCMLGLEQGKSVPKMVTPIYLITCGESLEDDFVFINAPQSGRHKVIGIIQ